MVYVKPLNKHQRRTSFPISVINDNKFLGGVLAAANT